MITGCPDCPHDGTRSSSQAGLASFRHLTGGFTLYGPDGPPVDAGVSAEEFDQGRAALAADRPSVTPRVGDTITTAEQLDALWDLQDVLIEASGTYANGMGSFTECWARPVPSFVGGAVGTWEVLVFGDEVPANLTTTSKITRATVLYVPGEQSRPSATDDARAERDALAARMPCDGGCNYGDGPMEDCSRHGRPPAEVWQIVTEVQAQRDALAARLAAVEALHRPARFEDAPEVVYCVHCQCSGDPFSPAGRTWPCATALAAAPTDTTKEN